MTRNIDIDNDVLVAAEGLAAELSEPLGKVISDLARKALAHGVPPLKHRRGVPILPKRPGVVVSNDLINRLRDEEGI